MIKKLIILFIFLLAISVNAQKERYEINNLAINNDYSNFGTAFFGTGKVVYASPKKKSHIIKNVWKGNNQPFLDLYIGDITEDGELINIEKFSNKLNSRFHEANAVFTKDGKTVYFSRNNYVDGILKKDSTGTGLIQLYRANIDKNGEWNHIQPMPFNNDNYQTGHPALSDDEKTLYFISDMPGSLGKTDIYKATLESDGSIGTPINLGPKINTAGHEMFVSVNAKNELYFSSDGRAEGLGGLDVYAVKIRAHEITEPQNLGSPINSDKDDFSFIVDSETNRGYFSSNRAGGKGDDDIYTLKQNFPLDFICQQFVRGDVREINSGELIPGALVVLYDHEMNEINRTRVGDLAKFEFEVACNTTYKMIGSKDGYIEGIREFYVDEGKDTEQPITVKLEEFVVSGDNCIIKIDPVYFDFNEWNIRPDAAIELNKVVAIMKKYPELIIEGGSHTDSRGSYGYNKTLSYKRASSTVKYIIENGIDPERISAEGYGESKIMNGCTDGVSCTDEAHQLNRRTEFAVVNFEEIKEKYPEICKVKIN